MLNLGKLRYKMALTKHRKVVENSVDVKIFVVACGIGTVILSCLICTNHKMCRNCQEEQHAFN